MTAENEKAKACAPDDMADPVDIASVIECELKSIEQARARDIHKDGDPRDKLLGLAFSGGGIRSATFNLGVLQGLSRAGLLKYVDYLSTVSGGGYIGSWLSAWIKRETGGVAAVERALAESPDANRVEAPPIDWLRRYSNYLTAKVGLFSIDTLAAVATYFRNLLLNQIELVALLGAVLLLPLILASIVQHLSAEWLWAGTGVVTYTIAIMFISLNLYHRDTGDGVQVYQSRTAVIFLVVVPLMISSGALGFAVAEMNPVTLPKFLFAYWPPAFAFTIFLQIVTWLLHKWRVADSVAGTFSAIRTTARDMISGTDPEKPLQYRYGPLDLLRIVLGLAIGVAAGLAGLWLFRELLPSPIRPFGTAAPDPSSIWHAVVWAVPAGLLAFAASTVFFLGIVGRVFSEEVREWWSRLGGLVLGLLFAWILIAAAAIYGPYLVGRMGGWIEGAGFAWLLTTLAGVLAGRSRFSTGAGNDADAIPWIDWIARLAPYFFALGLLLLVATALHAWLLYDAKAVAFSQTLSNLYWNSGFDSHANSLLPLLGADGVRAILIAFGALVAVVVLLSLTLDVNVFSFHMFYRNRLVRCYLGASNADMRKPHPFTGFDPTDSPMMKELACQRPYPIINTALNLTRAKNLAWQERKAASFAITPLFCGYDLDPGTGRGRGRYQPTASYLSSAKGWLPLGTAMTISGAAASPNMGYHTSSATALLLAVFNVRLGWWMQNTRSREDWGRIGPRFGVLWMIYELFALVHEERRFVYLSDGGHFENLGIYELLRRRCRFVIAVDAGCDKTFSFEDLGNAVRKCQVDLGVRIEIDPRAIVPDATTKLSMFHCAVGEIHYPADSGGNKTGYLLYIKPSLTGNEPVDVLEYAKAHPDFPHQSTADQWFGESQFESYRKLGRHVTSTVLESVRGSTDCEWLFQNLKERWYRPAKASAGAFSHHADQLKSIEQALRDSKELEFMDGQLIPEWSRLLAGVQPPVQLQLSMPATAAQRRAGFYLCTNMLQLMESVYLDLNLEEEWNHPDNRGWMNVFRNWSWSGMFMATFSVCCGMYGARFQRWCERRLNMWPGKVSAELRIVPEDGNAIDGWLQELERKDEINFVEMEELSARENGAYVFLKPRERLILFRMVCRPEVEIPGHRGGDGKELISFTFGVAVVSSASNTLVYFRIQDHLRRMGLARRSMRVLVHGGAVTVERVIWPKDQKIESEVRHIFDSVRKEPPEARNWKS